MSKKVFIAVGHGGKDAGACANGLKEKDVNLSVALEIYRQLDRHGVDVEISRKTDVTEDLVVRIAKANAFKPDCAFDVHFNAGGGDGFECFHQTNSYKTKSVALASSIEKEVIALGQKSRGLKTKLNGDRKDWFGFNRNVYCPALLLEGAFLDTADSQIVSTEEKRKAFGVAYAKGTLKYLGISWRDEKEDQVGANEKVETEEEKKDDLYRVQTGAFKETANATNFAKALKNKGFDTYIVKVGQFYKVQVGAYAKQDNAEAMRKKLVAKGYSDAFVLHNGKFVVSLKSIAEIAKEVIDGKWGNGTARKDKLKAAGYDPDEVQDKVNQLLG